MAKRQSFKHTSVPVVMLGRQNIAPYLYGYSGRILPPEPRAYLDKKDLQTIRDAVSNANGTMFEVTLRSVKSVVELKKGSKLLCLDLDFGGESARKFILEITGTETTKDGELYVLTKILWPEYAESSEGFFKADIAVEDPPDDRLYLHYTGPLPESPKQPFYDTVMEYAGDLVTLVECWTLCMREDLRDGKHLSIDSFVGPWMTGFRKKYGDIYHHTTVWDILYPAWYTNSLNGINKILDNRRGTNLISPLLDQIQQDILEVLYQNKPLAEWLFSEEQSAYWRKRLRVLIEKYYGPKSLIISSIRYQSESSGDVNHLSPKIRNKLSVLELFIKGSGTSAEAQSARNLYKRLSGRPYIG